MNRSAIIVGLGLAASAMLLTTLAGPINPPVGPVASTAKPLSEVEPRIAVNATNTPGDSDATPSLFKITQPGSYYLTGNITGVAGKHGIEIVASGVTLDLNGFDLVGIAGMGAFDGVRVTITGLTNIAVVNGSVRNWGGSGADLGNPSVSNCRIAAVLASGNGVLGISAGENTAITGCGAYSNSVGGIAVGSGCTVTNCAAYNNSGGGISGGRACTVTNCAAYNNSGAGIYGTDGCTITNCTASYSAFFGIGADSGTITDCTARNNTLDGIQCGSSSVILGNACSANGAGGDGAGIHVTGSDNRIEGNNCTGADRGIDVDGSGNIIIKNTCSGNGVTWTIAANNYYGPIIARAGVATAAVTGETATSTLGSTDPNANFSY